MKVLVKFLWFLVCLGVHALQLESCFEDTATLSVAAQLYGIKRGECSRK